MNTNVTPVDDVTRIDLDRLNGDARAAALAWLQTGGWDGGPVRVFGDDGMTPLVWSDGRPIAIDVLIAIAATADDAREDDQPETIGAFGADIHAAFHDSICGPDPDSCLNPDFWIARAQDVTRRRAAR